MTSVIMRIFACASDQRKDYPSGTQIIIEFYKDFCNYENLYKSNCIRSIEATRSRELLLPFVSLLKLDKQESVFFNELIKIKE